MPVLAALAALCLVLSVSFQIYDPDIWPQLARARALLTLHGIPTQQTWTWPDYGAPEHNATWGHALLLWPFWAWGGVTGLFAWRWVTVLATFGLAWRTARSLGARGVSVFAVIVACAMVYRIRSQMRPETLALILLALEFWILETRRQGGPDRTWWLVGAAWLWPSVHISYLVGLAVAVVFALDEMLFLRSPSVRRRPGKARPKPSGPENTAAAGGTAAPGRAPMLLVLLAAGIASFLNPWGRSVLAFPFEYMFGLRAEGFDRMVTELGRVNWTLNWRNGLPLLTLAWPALQLWRLRRGQFDRVEAILWASFTYEALSRQRFLSFWAVMAAPYLARGLDEFLRDRAAPGWWARPSFRTGATATACVAFAALECSRVELPLGFTFRPGVYPIAACDFMAKEGVRGRGFNYFEEGGYLLWRFWPDRGRLPFITNAPELSSPGIRMGYWRATAFWEDWRRLDDRYHFGYVLLKRKHVLGDHYADFLDADSSFAPVFLDDASALYVRRDGALAPVARRFAYRWLAGGENRMTSLGPRLVADANARLELRGELERAIQSSPRHALASDLMGAVMMLDGAWALAEKHLEQAHRLEPDLPGYFFRRGVIALETRRPSEAVRWFQAERRHGETPAVDLRLASALWAANDRRAAVDLLERATGRYPGEQPMRDTLATWRERLPSSR